MVDAVLSASRSLIAVATRSLGAAAEETTIAQYRALVVLASRGPQRIVDLAAALDVAPSTAGRMCDRLVRKGLIRRHRARADRRAVLVSVTAAGRLVVDQATARRRTLIEEILATLPEDAQRAVGRGATGVLGRGRGGTRQSVAAARARRGGGPAAGCCSFRSGRTRGPAVTAASGWPGKAAGWLRAGRGGMFLLALLIGAGSGLGAVVFRYLIYFFTWLATGHDEFGQQGRVASAHLPWLGPAFFVVIPVVGGLLYGPLIYRFAREARGHGVPEVMFAVADSGGRIRPQVSVVKALASAVCIGAGGSVGREGPIVQIGSALASSLGQRVRMPENRLRILVACGAAGGIAATFNAPITGVFFGVEIILREFSDRRAVHRDAGGDDRRHHRHPLPGRQAVPVRLPARHRRCTTPELPAGRRAGGDRRADGPGVQGGPVRAPRTCATGLWKGRPEWARPAVGGLALGLLLLALPQMYGVGYPVMDKATAGQYALWFLSCSRSPRSPRAA